VGKLEEEEKNSCETKTQLILLTHVFYLDRWLSWEHPA
jgi:hypothetical protein